MNAAKEWKDRKGRCGGCGAPLPKIGRVRKTCGAAECVRSYRVAYLRGRASTHLFAVIGADELPGAALVKLKIACGCSFTVPRSVARRAQRRRKCPNGHTTKPR